MGKSAEFGEAEILEKHVGEDVAATEVSRLNKVIVAMFFSTVPTYLTGRDRTVGTYLPDLYRTVGGNPFL